MKQTLGIKRINHPSGENQQRWYHDEQTGGEYCRIWGGLAWPAMDPNWPTSEPGFAVIIGQERIAYRATDVLIGLWEVEEFDLEALLQQCQDVTHIVDRWFGNTANSPRMALLHDASLSGGRFKLSAAPFVDKENGTDTCFQYGIPKIIGRTRKDKTKTLFLDACPKLTARLEALPPNIKPGAVCENFPAVAALTYLVTAFERYPFTDPSRAYTHTVDDSKGLFWRDR